MTQQWYKQKIEECEEELELLKQINSYSKNKKIETIIKNEIIEYKRMLQILKLDY